MQTFSVLFVVIASGVALAAPAVGGDHLLETVSVAGDEGWDHPTVDTAGGCMFPTAHTWS